MEPTSPDTWPSTRRSRTSSRCSSTSRSRTPCSTPCSARAACCTVGLDPLAVRSAEPDARQGKRSGRPSIGGRGPEGTCSSAWRSSSARRWAPRASLRSALGVTAGSRASSNRLFEPHERGAILVAAVFDAFFTVYAQRMRGPHADRRRGQRHGSGDHRGAGRPALRRGDQDGAALPGDVHPRARLLPAGGHHLRRLPAGAHHRGHRPRRRRRPRLSGHRDRRVPATGHRPSEAGSYSEASLRWQPAEDRRGRPARLRRPAIRRHPEDPERGASSDARRSWATSAREDDATRLQLAVPNGAREWHPALDVPIPSIVWVPTGS